jgi:hypothetical protein
MKTIIAIALLLAAGCATPAQKHLRMFCSPALADSDRGLVEGLLCQPVPADIPLETLPAAARPRK